MSNNEIKKNNLMKKTSRKKKLTRLVCLLGIWDWDNSTKKNGTKNEDKSPITKNQMMNPE